MSHKQVNISDAGTSRGKCHDTGCGQLQYMYTGMFKQAANFAVNFAANFAAKSES